MTPIQPRALKVEGGRIVHVQEEGKPGNLHGLEAPPDGTYLRLDYVLDVVGGMRAQVDSARDSSDRVLASLETFLMGTAL